LAFDGKPAIAIVSKLVAKEIKIEDRIAALNKKLGKAERPAVLVSGGNGVRSSLFTLFN